MEFGDKVRDRCMQGCGVGTVVQISVFGTVQVDFGRAGKRWVLEERLELAARREDSSMVPKSAKTEPRYPGLRVQEGWLIEHDEFEWGDVLAREGPNVLISFQVGEKILTDGGLPEHVLQYDSNPSPDDPRHAPHRTWGTNWASTPGRNESRHQFSRPNTKAWNWNK
jgi:hypothetical protein